MSDVELVVKIDEKEFGIDIQDKFQDFFKRLKAEIKHHMISGTNLVCGAYELETIEMFLTAFKNATIEQEPILDKIRAEIEQEYNHLGATRADETLELGECLGLKMSLKILDKYKTESEDIE